MTVVPKEIREVAEQAARDEFEFFDEPGVRQMARQIGGVIAQAVWDALEERHYR